LRVLLLVLLVAWLGLGLFGHDPWKPDEAYSFGLVYHILEKGDWLVPTLAGEPFVEKPPLFYWTAALFAKGLEDFVPLHDAARLASAFYVALTLWFTYLLGRRNVAAPLFLAACLGYLQHAHQLVTDNALMAGMAIGLYALLDVRPLLLGTAAGIAFLSKGLLGPGLLGLIAVVLVAFPEWRRSWRGWPLALAAFAPWALIWPVIFYIHSPALFREWFWVNNFGRFGGWAGLGGVADHWHYAKALAWFAFPAWPFAVWTAATQLRTAEARFNLVAFVIMLGVLSVAASARTIYGLPLLIPIAALAAQAMPARWLEWPFDKLATWGGAAAGLALWALWGAFLAGWRPPWLEVHAPGFVPRIEPAFLVAAILVTALWALTVILKLEPRLPARWLAAVTLVWGLAMTLWLPWLDYGKSYRGVIADMQRSRARPP